MTYFIDHCPSCKSKDLQLESAKLSRFVVWQITGHDPYQDTPNNLAVCLSCNLKFSLIRFTDNENIALYTNYRSIEYNKKRIICDVNYTEKVNSFAESTPKRLEFITNFITQTLGNKIIDIKSILDYGGDNGSLIPNFKNAEEKYVYDISGVELLPNITRLSDDIDKKFDLVMCCQVLEHVSAFENILNNIKNYANKYIYVEVPCYKNPIPKNVTISEHLNFFDNNSLSRLLENFKLQIIDYQYNFDLGVLGMLSLLDEKIKK